MTRHIGLDVGGSSVKAVSLDSYLATHATAASDFYTNPDREQLLIAMKQAVGKLDISSPERIGLCVPGKMSRDESGIELSVNLPALNGWRFDELIADVFGQSKRYWVISDADAAGLDYATTHPIQGRTAAISIGTGVGLCVLDGTQIVRIGSKGIGHLGLMDVGKFGDQDRIDERGVRNTLEAYIGAHAVSEFQTDGKLDLASLTPTHPSMGALFQSLRVVHAIYQPDRIVLLGGVGNALAMHKHRIRELVSDGLTRLAVKNWKLEFGDSHFHAAFGAAKHAAQSG
jgi:predicted NBD/HSP70 family sugar kinase